MNEHELLEHYRPWLRTVARGMLAGRPGVEDLAAEGWIAVWKALHARRDVTTKAPLDWWLKRQAVLRMKTCLRDWHDPVKHRQHVLMDDVTAVVDLPAELGAIELAYHHGEILAALNELTPNEREYVWLRFWVHTGGRFNPLLRQRFGKDAFDLWRTARPKLAAALGHLQEARS